MIEEVKIRVLPDGRVSRADAAKFLGLGVQTLAYYYSKGIGPRSVRVGAGKLQRVFYYLADLEAFRDNGAREAA